MTVRLVTEAGVRALPPASTGVVMGIDPSSSTGVVVLAGNVVLHAGIVPTLGTRGYERLQLIAGGVVALYLSYPVKEVFVESPLSHGGWNLVSQVEAGTVIRMGLYSAGAGWWDVSPTSLKKWVSGKGHASKKEMMAAVTSRWGFESSSNDVNDAYALARIGQHVIGGADQLKGVRRGHKTVQA
jgi:crossover junction endodeoxyribonuclease RuvC